MARRRQGWFELIASMPWQAGIAVGVFAYIVVRYGVGWYLGSAGSPMLATVGKTLDGSALAPLAWMLLALCWLAALLSFIGRRRRGRLLESQTGLDSLRAMSWREFEMLVGEAFRRQGYQIEETGLGGADGGIDLRLSKDGSVTLVQCKQWRNQRVDVKVVREMYGLLAHYQAHAVKIVAIGDYTPDARRFAQGKPVELIGGAALLAMIRSVQASQPQAHRTFQSVQPPRTARPECPKCGAPMVKRANRHTHDSFWGCPHYPACRGTRAG